MGQERATLLWPLEPVILTGNLLASAEARDLLTNKTGGGRRGAAALQQACQQIPVPKTALLHQCLSSPWNPEAEYAFAASIVTNGGQETWGRA